MGRRLIRTAVPITLAMAALAACSGSGEEGQGATSASTAPSARVTPLGGGGGGGQRLASAPFVEFDSCDALVDWTREAMLDRVTAYGLDRSSPVWPTMGIAEPAIDAVPMAASETTVAAGGRDATAAAPEGGGTSGTNTHTEGVDEGDITETDGRYVYSIVDGTLRSVDLDTATVVSAVSAPAWATDMVLYGDRLLVAGTDWSSSTGDTSATTYAVDAGTLTSLGTTHLEGSLVSVRSIDGTARLVVSQPLGAKLPFVQPRDGSRSQEDDALDQNRAVIEAATAEQLLPRRYTDGPLGGSTTPEQAIDCSQVGRPATFSGLSVVWVATVDLTGADAPVIGSAGVVADAQTVYSSHDTLYVATTTYPDQDGDTVPVNGQSVRTAILAFDLAASDGADYEASGEVDGTTINQYALSEYAGSLRVATTTTSGGFGDSTESGVHVLQRQGDQLVEVGSIGGLGRGETIQGVRFFDDRGYVVTFRQTDPLFVLDLSDPTAPRLTGELKVPGYSAYLQPLADGRLLTIGMAGTDAGQITGTQLSLFDVSDPTTPALVGTLDLGAWGSEAVYDPHAFLYWPETGTVVAPIDSQTCWDGPWVDEDGDGRNDQLDVCDAAVAATVTADGVTEAGRLQGTQPIRRAMVANGRLVTVDSTGVVIRDLTTLDVTATIPFT